MICTFSEPKNNAGNTPAKLSDPWNYSIATCINEPTGSGPGSYTKITIPGDTRYYDYSNSITTGDFMVAGFLVMVLIALMCWGIYLLTFRRKY